MLSAFPVSTRSLPALVGATASATQTRKKNAGQCSRPPPLVFSAVAHSHSHRGCPTSFCSGLRNAYADLYFFPAVTRSHPYSPEKGLPGLWWLFEAATPRGAPRYCSVKNSTIPAVLRGVSCTA